MWRALIFFLFAALPAEAEEQVVAGLSQTRISISTNFDGSQILIFGAVKRESPIPAGPLQVVITVAGPSEPVVVRRKSKQYGIWINTAQVDVDAAPSFYAVSTSALWNDSISDTEDLRHKISILRAIRSVGASIPGTENFTDALIRIRTGNGLYQTNIGTVKVDQETLFDTAVTLPSNLREGSYTVRFYLTRGGRVIDSYQKEIAVRKVGLERFLFKLAHDQSLSYGILALSIAVFAGWGASAAFRLIRN